MLAYACRIRRLKASRRAKRSLSAKYPCKKVRVSAVALSLNTLAQNALAASKVRLAKIHLKIEKITKQGVNNVDLVVR